MSEYHKIQSLYKRDPATNNKRFIIGDYSIPEFEYLRHAQWQFTEKVDGTNIRILLPSNDTIGDFEIRGKTDEAQIPPQLLKTLTEHFKAREDMLREKFPAGAVIYGEGYGAKIQKGGGNYRQDQHVVIFDVNINGYWLQRKDIEDVAATVELDVVPVIGYGTLDDMHAQVACGFKSRWGDFQAEGIVARPTVELGTRRGDRIITKLKYKDFQ